MRCAARYSSGMFPSVTPSELTCSPLVFVGGASCLGTLTVFYCSGISLIRGTEYSHLSHTKPNEPSSQRNLSSRTLSCCQLISPQVNLRGEGAGLRGAEETCD